jgi:hypothetical protein
MLVDVETHTHKQSLAASSFAVFKSLHRAWGTGRSSALDNRHILSLPHRTKINNKQVQATNETNTSNKEHNGLTDSTQHKLMCCRDDGRAKSVLRRRMEKEIYMCALC